MRRAINKVYNVVFETDAEVISEFQIQAISLEDARRLAQTHKRMTMRKQCRTRVYLAK